MPFISSIRKQHNLPVQKESIASKFEITGGDSIITAGGYRIHMFTSVGEAKLNIRPRSNLPSSEIMALQSISMTAEYLVVGGGGAGGSRHGGGGGAGGMVVSTTAQFVSGSYPVGVGAGGTGITGDSTGNSGQNSTLSTTTAVGGGGGGTWATGGGAAAGGSGGGASGPSVAGASATQPASQPYGGTGYGYPGGSSTVWGNPIGLLRVGGGGGAGGAGSSANLNPGAGAYNATGGPGRALSIVGSSYYWAGGGGGHAWAEAGGNGGVGGGGGGTGGPAGLGGGQALNSGGNSTYTLSTTDGYGGNGGANTGSGGGGGAQVPSTGGQGGPGIVVFRYLV